jgi:hypothetical protein
MSKALHSYWRHLAMSQNKHTAAPQVLPDVATQPHPLPAADPGPALASDDPESPKDRLETRPEGELATPLDPASPEARGWPLDPKPASYADDGDDDEAAPEG